MYHVRRQIASFDHLTCKQREKEKKLVNIQHVSGGCVSATKFEKRMESVLSRLLRVSQYDYLWAIAVRYSLSEFISRRNSCYSTSFRVREKIEKLTN